MKFSCSILVIALVALVALASAQETSFECVKHGCYFEQCSVAETSDPGAMKRQQLCSEGSDDLSCHKTCAGLLKCGQITDTACGFFDSPEFDTCHSDCMSNKPPTHPPCKVEGCESEMCIPYDAQVAQKRQEGRLVACEEPSSVEDVCRQKCASKLNCGLEADANGDEQCNFSSDQTAFNACHTACVSEGQEPVPSPPKEECKLAGCNHSECVSVNTQIATKRQEKLIACEEASEEDKCRNQCAHKLLCGLHSDDGCAFAPEQTAFDGCYSECLSPVPAPVPGCRVAGCESELCLRKDAMINAKICEEPTTIDAKCRASCASKLQCGPTGDSSSEASSAEVDAEYRCAFASEQTAFDTCHATCVEGHEAPPSEEECHITGCMYEKCIGVNEITTMECRMAVTKEDRCRVKCHENLVCAVTDGQCDFVANDKFTTCVDECNANDRGVCGMCGGVCQEVFSDSPCGTPKRLSIAAPEYPCEHSCEVEYSTCGRNDDDKCAFIQRESLEACKKACQVTKCYKVGCGNDLCSPNPGLVTTCEISSSSEELAETPKRVDKKTEVSVAVVGPRQCRSKCASQYGVCSLTAAGSCYMGGSDFEDCVKKCEDIPTPSDCEQGETPVNCFADPCGGDVADKCPNHPDAECRASYCDSCRANFFVDDVDVTDDCARPEVVCGGLGCRACAEADGCSACYGTFTTDSSEVKRIAHCVPDSVAESDRCLSASGDFAIASDVSSAGISLCETFEGTDKPEPTRPVIREDFDEAVNANAVAIKNTIASKYVIVIVLFVRDGDVTEESNTLNVFKVAVDLVDSTGGNGEPTDEDKAGLCSLLKNSLQETQAIHAATTRCFVDKVVDEATPKRQTASYSYLATLEGQEVSSVGTDDQGSSGASRSASFFSATVAVILSIFALF